MESVASILDKYIDEYLAETKIPFTKLEVYETSDHILPLTNNGEVVIGFVAINMYNSQHFNETIPSLRTIYISPEYREPNSFKKVSLYILDMLKQQGYNRIEIAVDRKINNWLKKKGNSRPTQFVHIQTIDYLVNNIKGE
jgi:hypothetical protein